MTIGSTSGTILIAAIPVAAMLFAEAVLPWWWRRRERGRGEDVPSAPVGRESSGASSGQAQRPSRWRQDGRYYRILHQTANMGNLASMDKLGELALVRKDYAEAFYWRLMMELLGAPSPGLSADGICRLWTDAKCPDWHPAEGGLFTERQARFARAVLDLWSGRHLHAPLEAIRRMVRDGEREACLFARCFGTEEPEP